MHRWLLPLSALCILVGYWGPWVPHRVAGLVVTGLDLGEYVKFLPVIRNGQVLIWREGFYGPLVAVSLTLSLTAFRPTYRYGWPLRLFCLLWAGIAALNLLPPAWSQHTFVNPEFRQQILALGLCLGAVAVSPFLALLPRWFYTMLVIALSAAAAWFPPRAFLQVLPAIRELYQQPLQPGWGFYLMLAGLLFLVVAQWLPYWAPAADDR
ncbi:MAG: hypothetical protein KF832_11495 [Caldilineaceae bacterium]|nr:hypothetical protein [Caldilineaceae bacterium]